MTAIPGQERAVDPPPPDGLSHPWRRWNTDAGFVLYDGFAHGVDLSTEPSDPVAELIAAGEDSPEAGECGPRQSGD